MQFNPSKSIFAQMSKLSIRSTNPLKITIILLVGTLSTLLYGQQSYNECTSAKEICPNSIFSLTNIGANKTVCPGCEDDFTFCFVAHSTIWLKFTTNATGGSISLAFSNLVFQTAAGQDNMLQAQMLQATVPCNSASYTPVGNCVSNGMSSFTLSAVGLLPNTVYYVVISGDLSGAGITKAAECSFDVQLTGAGVNRVIPSISLAPSSLSLCKNQLFVATASITDCPNNSTYKWYVNSVLKAQTSSPQFQSTELVTGDVVKVETSCFTLCKEVISASSPAVSVYSFPVNAGADLSIKKGETVQLNGTTTAAIFSWSPASAVSDSSSLSPFVSPIETTVYTLSATDNGCTLKDAVSVVITNKLVFPSSFSPNNDGINDTWEIVGIEEYPDCLVKIFSRWGQEVYSTTGYSKKKSWAGATNSGTVSEGVYYYIVELRDAEKQVFKGYINIIR